MAKLRTYTLLKPIFSMRDWLWTKLGLFKLKQSIKRKRYFKQAAKEDEARRRMIAEKIMQLPDGMLKPVKGINIVVSITSYGYRVEKSSPYALYSILQQSHLPNRIVLNINQEKWNDEIIPELLKKLQKVGVEINYTEDIGPHTKFIPALKKYPNDIIITADDDVYYDKGMIDELYGEYEKSDKKSVICRECKCVVKKDGKILPYSELPYISECKEDGAKIPFGVAGVLYPPHIFGDEIFNFSALKQLAPKADDIWFAAMELFYGVHMNYVPNNSWRGDLDVDRNEEYNADVSGALYLTNEVQGQNDVQWEAVVAHYHLNDKI